VSVAGAIVDGDGRVLVVQRRDNGRWEPPGGVLELAESIYDGLLREVREETGLDVEVEALTGIYKNLPRGIVALVFRCRPVGGSLRLNEEVSKFRWLSRADAAAFLDEAYAVRLTDALDGLPSPAVRSHDGVRLLPPLTNA
jgi:8-oxo-dGTP pyrophosphatase MutT (NUDIX family)